MASLDSAPIPFEVHERWFARSLERADRKLWVVEVDGQGVGVARLDLDGRTATVSIHLAPESRGRGIGPDALRALETLARDLGISRLLAAVKADNGASLRAFRKAGFEGPVAAPVATLVKAVHGC